MSTKKRITQLSIDRVALVSAGSNPHADVVLTKNKPPIEPLKETEQMTTNIDKSKLSADEQKTLDAILAKCATTTEVLPTPDELVKTLPLELQALVKSAQDTAARAVAQAEEAQAAVALEKAKREENEFVTSQTAIVKAYPGKADDSASLLFRIKKAVPDADYTALEVLIKAGNAALASVMTISGNDVVTDDGSDSIVKKLPEMARARAAEKKIPYSKALEELTIEHASEIQKGRRDKARRARRDDDN